VSKTHYLWSVYIFINCTLFLINKWLIAVYWLFGLLNRFDWNIDIVIYINDNQILIQFISIFHVGMKLMYILLCNICGCRETGWRNPTGFLNIYFTVFHILWYMMCYEICYWFHMFEWYRSLLYDTLNTVGDTRM